MLVCDGVGVGVEGRREGSNTQQNRKCFELYIPAISDKLREEFVINHMHAVLPTKRIAWWAAAWDLGACCCLVWSPQPAATPRPATLLWGICHFQHKSADSVRGKSLCSCFFSFSSSSCLLSPQQFTYRDFCFFHQKRVQFLVFI